MRRTHIYIELNGEKKKIKSIKYGNMEWYFFKDGKNILLKQVSP